MSITTAPRQIAMGDPRVFEDFRLTDSTPEKIREIGVVGTAYDSVFASDITYVSTPITSGAVLYSAMDQIGVTDPHLLKRDAAQFEELVIAPNLAAADKVAHAMVRFGGAVIAPAAFEARSLAWGQDEYMGLWLDVIERKATRLAMVDGWEYSNGGAEEYLQALLMQAGRRDRSNMTIVDARGETIGHITALRLLADAFTNLTSRGFTPTVLARVLNRCIILHGMVRDETEYGQSSDRCGKPYYQIGQGYIDASASNAEMRDCVFSLKSTIHAIRKILPYQEVVISSSVELAPGIVRVSERNELVGYPVKIIREEDSK